MSSKARAVCWVIGAMVLLAAGVEYAARGPLRAAAQSGDLAAPFAAGRALARHENPYDQNVLQAELEAATDDPAGPGCRVTMSVYPPHTFVLMLPVSLLSWPHARIACAVVNVVLPALALALFLRTRRGTDGSALQAFACVFLFLALAPYQTGIGLGQPAVCAVALLFLAVLLAERSRPVSSGVMLGLAVLLKAPLGLPFLLFFGLRRWWTPLLVCVILGLAVSVGLLIWWGPSASMDYLAAAVANVKKETVIGSLNPASPHYYHRIDLAPLTVVSSVQLRALFIGVSAALALLGAAVVWRVRLMMDRPEAQALVLAALCLLSLLVVYHGYYDAFLLFLPACYAAYAMRFSRGEAVFLLLILPAFLFPIGTAMHVAGKTVPWLGRIVSAPVVGRLITLHLNVILLVLFLWVLWRAWRLASAPAASAEPISEVST